MKEKKCFKCGKIKKLGLFYYHKQMADGHLNKCKTCAKKDVKKRYQNSESIEKIRAYEKKRSQDPERKKRALEYQKTRRAKYPNKNKARNKVSNSLRDKKIEKQPCEICGEIKVEAHHPDYRRPLHVQWLCHKHHLEIERKKDNGKKKTKKQN